MCTVIMGCVYIHVRRSVADLGGAMERPPTPPFWLATTCTYGMWTSYGFLWNLPFS